MSDLRRLARLCAEAKMSGCRVKLYADGGRLTALGLYFPPLERIQTTSLLHQGIEDASGELLRVLEEVRGG